MKQTGYVTVELKDDYIYCVVAGHIEAQMVRDSLAKTRVFAEQIRHENKVPRLLINARGVRNVTSQARTVTKELGDIPVERIAILRGDQFMMMIARYILQVSSISSRTKFFRSRSAAERWLKNETLVDAIPGSKIGHSTTTTYVSILSVLVPILVLFGWLINNETMKRLYPGLTAMNPLTAVCFILLGTSLWLHNKVAPPKVSRAIIMVANSIIIIVGVIVLLRTMLGINLPIDRLLFHSKLDSPGYPPSKIALNTALNFILVGSGLTIAARKGRQAAITAQAMLLIAATTVTAAIIGYAYGFSRLYRIGTFIPMALHTAILFLLVIIGIFTCHPEWNVTRMFRRTNRFVWIGCGIVSLTLLLTGIAWHQNIDKNKQQQMAQYNQDFTAITTSLAQRLDAYTNSLNGFRAFFAASDLVTRGDFHHYFTDLNLNNTYPGVRSISFIRDIPASKEQSFINQVRNDDTLPGQVLSTYNIYPQTGASEVYPVTYAEPSTSRFGFDVGTEPSRLSNLLNAKNTGEISASTTVNLNQLVPNSPVLNGFFITLPVYQNPDGTVGPNKTNTVFGYINATFVYQKLFDNLFNDYTQKGIAVSLYDESSGTPLYSQKSSLDSGQKTISHETIVNAAGRPWKLQVTALDSYGLTASAQNTPHLILAGGTLASLLLLVLFANLAQARSQALRLAMNMTNDLKAERDHAVITKEQDEAILSSIGDAVFAIDTTGKIVLFNPAAVHISGFTQDEAVGKTYDEILQFVHADTGRPSHEFIHKAMQGHISSMHNHTLLIRKDGSHVSVADSAAPIRRLDGTLQGVIVVFRDVTKEEQLDKAKADFVSLASHQLRTPLSAINWYSEMLLQGDAGKTNKEQTAYLREIYEGNQRMIELVNSLLDVSRLEVGKMVNKHEPVDVSAVVDSIHKELMTSIDTKHTRVNLSIASKLTPVQADTKLIRMLIQNLMSNAVKYTPDKGTVDVILRKATASEIKHAGLPAVPCIFFSVKDSGYGIPKEQQAHIFEKLFRADNVRKLDVEGTGLGLYIVKQVTETMGGKVWFESIETIGTTFTIILPFVTKVSKQEQPNT